MTPRPAGERDVHWAGRRAGDRRGPYRCRPSGPARSCTHRRSPRSRAFTAAALATLPPSALTVAAGPPYLRSKPRKEQDMTTPETGTRGLLIVDVQNDFVEGGWLGVDGGEGGRRADQRAPRRPRRRATPSSRPHATGTTPTAPWRPLHDRGGPRLPRHLAGALLPQGNRAREYAPGLVTDAVTDHIRKGRACRRTPPSRASPRRRRSLDRRAPRSGSDRGRRGRHRDGLLRSRHRPGRAQRRIRGAAARRLHAGVGRESSDAALAELDAAGVQVDGAAPSLAVRRATRPGSQTCANRGSGRRSRWPWTWRSSRSATAPCPSC